MSGPAAKLRGLFHSPGPLHTSGTPKNDYNRKFHPPDKHPLQMEDHFKEMVPLNHRRKAAYENTLKRTANNARDLEVVRTAKRMLTELKINDSIDQFDENHAQDFMFWLAGKSRLNHPRITPWGSRSLFHLPEVVQYFREYISKREEFRKALLMLWFDCRQSGPSGLKQSYLFYKFLAEQYEDYHDKFLHDELDFNDPRRFPFYTMDQMIEFLDIWRQPEESSSPVLEKLNNWGTLGSNKIPLVRGLTDSPTDESKFDPDVGGPRPHGDLVDALEEAINVRHLDAPEFMADRLRDPAYRPSPDEFYRTVEIKTEHGEESIHGHLDDPHIQKLLAAKAHAFLLTDVVEKLTSMSERGPSGTALIHNAIAEGNANIVNAIKELKRVFNKKRAKDFDPEQLRELQREVTELERTNERLQQQIQHMENDAAIKDLRNALNGDNNQRHLNELRNHIARLEAQIRRFEHEDYVRRHPPPPLPPRVPVLDDEIDAALQPPQPGETSISVAEARKLKETGRESPIAFDDDDSTEEYLLEDERDTLLDFVPDLEPDTPAPSGPSEPAPSIDTPESKPQKDIETLHQAAHQEAKDIAKDIQQAAGEAPDSTTVRLWTDNLRLPKERAVIADLVAGGDWLINTVLPLAREEKRRHDEQGEAGFDLSPALRNYLRLVHHYKHRMARGGAILARNYNSKRYLKRTTDALKRGTITEDQALMARKAFRWFEDDKKRGQYSNGLSPLDELDTLLKDMGHEVPFRRKPKSPSKSPRKVTFQDESE